MMSFYEFYEPGEALDEPVVSLAARELINSSMQVIPLVKGLKEPANVKSVYELISHPINERNFDYYFTNRDVDLGLILQDDMEFIDIDEKNKVGITQDVLKAIELGWPEVYEKLAIDKTATGGCHLIYRSEIVGGRSCLAKVQARPQPVAIIELCHRSNKQYIKISPSEGYHFIQRHPLNIQTLSAEERNWLVAVCCSFNEVIEPEVTKADAEREDSPWAVFNSQHDWKWIKSELTDRRWKVVSEDETRVIIKRPGKSQQRASGKIFKEKNVLYLFTVSTEFEDARSYTPFGVYALLYHDNNVKFACKQLAAEGVGKNNLDEGRFWKRYKSKIKIKYTELLSWLHQIGFRKYQDSIVQVQDNIVELVDENLLKKVFLTEVEYDMQDEMYERVATIFSDQGGLVAMLKPLDDNFIRDTKGQTWLFFKNLAIEISDKIKPFEYKELQGYIWKSQVIDRDFYEVSFSGCDADRFVKILAGDRKENLQKLIGYMISRFKDPLNARAVILIEDIDSESEGEAQGGSGKSLLFQFIEQYRKACFFDGKNFRPTDQFCYQNVEPDTCILFIDDVDKQFRFHSLFSILTGSLPVNKKNRPQQIIEFSKSPKVFITSNYSIGGMDISAKRRRYEFAIIKYFGLELEPIDEFGREFFHGWDKKEWLRFDNFICHCALQYLAEADKKSLENITENSAERSLINNTNKDFIEYMDGQLSLNFFDFSPLFLRRARLVHPDGSMMTNAVDVVAFEQNRHNPDYYFMMTKEQLFEKVQKLCHAKWLTTTKLTQWVKLWAAARDVEIDCSYKRSSDGERSYRLLGWKVGILDKTGNWRPNNDW